jgi:hypothetical protein
MCIPPNIRDRAPINSVSVVLSTDLMKSSVIRVPVGSPASAEAPAPSRNKKSGMII